MIKLSIIVPCYYNELNIPVTTDVLIENEKRFSADVSFEYIMIDDGSGDGTLEALKKFQSCHKNVKIIKFTRNFGSYNAITAGFEYATGDCLVTLSADLQDPPELIVQMFEYWQKGIKLVLANRQDRDEPWTQKLFSNTYHKLIKKFALSNSPTGGFDLVLFDKQLQQDLLKIQEKNTNVLYLLLWLGYDYINIPYVRRKRDIGVSRWTFSKKIKLFVDSFVSFSYLPIRAISVLGIALGFVAVSYGVYILACKMLGLVDVRGWTTMMIVFLFVSSFQMISLGVIGEYVWRSLDASRKRPNYVIDEVLDGN